MTTAQDSPSEEPQAVKRGYHRAALRYPYYSLTDSLVVAKVIHERGGGIASNDQIAALLDYSSPKNGAYLNRVSAARMFGLITRGEGGLRLTPRTTAILMPTYAMDRQRALIDAFLEVPLFKAVFDETSGQPLPPEFGLKNMLRTKFNIGPSTIDVAYRTLMSSAEDAGFFATRGNRTHLILPVISSAPGSSSSNESREEEEELPSGGGTGGDGRPPSGPPTPPAPTSAEQVRLEYVRKLISLLGADGSDQNTLMERIEKLLQAETPNPV